MSSTAGVFSCKDIVPGNWSNAMNTLSYPAGGSNHLELDFQKFLGPAIPSLICLCQGANESCELDRLDRPEYRSSFVTHADTYMYIYTTYKHIHVSSVYIYIYITCQHNMLAMHVTTTFFSENGLSTVGILLQHRAIQNLRQHQPWQGADGLKGMLTNMSGLRTEPL